MNRPSCNTILDNLTSEALDISPDALLAARHELAIIASRQ